MGWPLSTKCKHCTPLLIWDTAPCVTVASVATLDKGLFSEGFSTSLQTPMVNLYSNLLKVTLKIKFHFSVISAFHRDVCYAPLEIPLFAGAVPS